MGCSDCVPTCKTKNCTITSCQDSDCHLIFEETGRCIKHHTTLIKRRANAQKKKDLIPDFTFSNSTNIQPQSMGITLGSINTEPVTLRASTIISSLANTPVSAIINDGSSTIEPDTEEEEDEDYIEDDEEEDSESEEERTAREELEAIRRDLASIRSIRTSGFFGADGLTEE